MGPKLGGQIDNVPTALWEMELETTSSKFHLLAAWAAVVFDPIFGIIDYLNMPEGWTTLLIMRLLVSAITVCTILLWKRFSFSSYIVVLVPFSLISFQNACTYQYIAEDGLLGQNLNYIALLIGASMFVLWHWKYSVAAIVLSAMVTFLFVVNNHNIGASAFFLKGGLLLAVSAIFMGVLIHTRYRLTLRELKVRLALRISNKEIKEQAGEIVRINENLEQLVRDRTQALEKKNKALEEYAFINAHKLRSPLASILGLINLLTKMELDTEANSTIEHLKKSSDKLDDVVSDITKAIEKGDE